MAHLSYLHSEQTRGSYLKWFNQGHAASVSWYLVFSQFWKGSSSVLTQRSSACLPGLLTTSGSPTRSCGYFLSSAITR